MSKAALNPRAIAKLVRHLRDAGAYHVEVKADGSITADFPQPIRTIQQYPWYWQRPQWTGPFWDITYTGNGGTITGTNPFTPITTSSDVQVSGGSTTALFESIKGLSEVSLSDMKQAMDLTEPDESHEMIGGGPSGTFTGFNNTFDNLSGKFGDPSGTFNAAPGGGTRMTFSLKH